MDTYKDKRKHLRLKLIDPHEITENLSKIIDPIVANFLDKLEKKGHLEKSILFFYSDHGDHSDFILMRTESGRAELMNPYFFMTIPSS